MFTLLLCPFAPHLAEECWAELGGEGLASLAPWPKHDEEKIKDDSITVAVSVLGKFQATVTVPVDADEDTVFAEAMKLDKVAARVAGKEVFKRIYIKGKMLNILCK